MKVNIKVLLRYEKVTATYLLVLRPYGSVLVLQLALALVLSFSWY